MRLFKGDSYFYQLILTTAFFFEIRTQGITLIFAVFVYFLLNKKWFKAFAYVVGTYIATLPWVIRNMISGLGGSRYIDQILVANTWRPEEGTITFGDIILRGFNTLEMLLTKAIPSSIMPYYSIDYASVSTFGEWLVAIVIVVLVIYGFLSFKKISILLISYVVFTIGIICLWSAPSGSRYLTTILPILEIGLVLGVYYFIIYVSEIFGIKKKINPLWMVIPIAFLVIPQLQLRHQAANSNYYPAQKNFFDIAKAVKKNVDPALVVCSRKPELFFMFASTNGCGYAWSADTEVLIEGLINSKVDYVVLDQLGFSSTPRYLLPAINANKELFTVIIHLSNPDTYLLKFDREKAIKKHKL